MNYRLNSFKLIAMMIAAGMTLVSTASAQSIPGVFVGANTVNTERQDGNGAFSALNGNVGPNFDFWADRSGNAPGDSLFAFDGSGNSGSLTTSGGFLGTFTDFAIVTTISGLDAGTYDVQGIFSLVFGNTDFQYAAGLTAAGTSQIADSVNLDRYSDVGTPNFPGDAFGADLGVATVGGDGELKVYLDILSGANQNTAAAYNGVSYVQLTSTAVPEPSSLALLLGLGGLVMARRRR